MRIGQKCKVKLGPITTHVGYLIGQTEVVCFGAKTLIGLVDLGMDGGFWSENKTTFVTLLAVAMECIEEVR